MRPEERKTRAGDCRGAEARVSVSGYGNDACRHRGGDCKAAGERVAIIGLGGSGSYILDLLAKTPIGEIHLYDGDEFALHNSFRAPGAPAEGDLTEPKKVDWFADIYDRMRTGITRHPYYVRAEQLPEFTCFDFVFVAVDDAKARKIILEGLIALKVPFIDVGIDVALDRDNSLRGICRFTAGTPDCHAHIPEVVSFGEGPVNEVYHNIQVADLNMLNASMAVIKWKKLRGFYADDIAEHHSLYAVATHGLTKEDRK